MQQPRTGERRLHPDRGGASPTISATITLDSGASIVGREIYILQSNGTTCLDLSLAGTWAPLPAPVDGPQTFTVGVVAGATRFAVHLPASGGGGTDIYTSFQVTLP